ADGSFVLEAVQRLNCRIERVPLPSFGPLRAGAALVRDWLRARAGEEIVLVSLSKGGAEGKLALAEPDAAETFRPVRAWGRLWGGGWGCGGWSWGRRWRAGCGVGRGGCCRSACCSGCAAITTRRWLSWSAARGGCWTPRCGRPRGCGWST